MENDKSVTSKLPPHPHNPGCVCMACLLQRSEEGISPSMQSSAEIANTVPPHLRTCETETIPGKSFVTRPEYPGLNCHCDWCEPKLSGDCGEPHDTPARPLTYLACPYSDPSPGVMEWRYEQATKAAAWLISKHELNVFSPITHSHPLHMLGGCKGDWGFWEKIDREYLGASNALVVLYLDGWNRSVGVDAEVTIAKEMGIRVDFLIPTADGEYTFSKNPGDWPPMRMPVVDSPQCEPSKGVGNMGREDFAEDAIKDTAAFQAEFGVAEQKMRTFATGATRNLDSGKPDYEGFLSPLALEEFGKYMLSHQIQADGSRRDSDNWQKGIPPTAYMKSLWRHLIAVWMLHRGYTVPNDEQGRPVTLKTALSATIFNAQGYLHEVVKKDRE
jgi:Domain of unknown function (DUF1937)